MKKIFTLLLVMMGFFAQSMYAEPLKNPDPAKTYMIQHSSGLFLTVDGNSAKIMSAGSGTSQKFTFEIVADAENTYNIKLEDGRYLGSDGSYTVKFLEDPADDFTRFTFWECTEVDHVKMWNLGRNAYFGTDQNNDGAGVYSDKNGYDGKHAWRFVEASDGLIYSALETAIANAKNNVAEKPVSESFTQEGVDAYNAAIATAEAALESATEQSEVNEAAANLSAFTNAVNYLFNAISYANETLAAANIGDTTGSYPQASADALSAAIAEAVATWASADPEAYNAAVPVLNNAVATFGNTRYVFVPEAGKKYYFVNTYNNLMLGVNSNGEAVLANPTAEDNQKFEFVPVEGLSVAFNLKIADGSGYLAYKGGWNSTTLADPAQEAAQIFFDIVDLEKKVYTLNRFNFNGAWASDENNPGSLIYTNKSRNQLNAKWQILEVVDGEFLTIGLEKAIENAENYISKAVVGEEPGNYPQSAVDALSAALNTAKNAVPASQQDVNDITDTLNAAINAFLAEKIDPFFIPEENTAYRFSVRKYSSKFMTNNDGAIGTSEFTAGNTAQHWTFIPVEGAKYTYIIKNDGKALSYEGTAIEVADADAPKWTVVYTATIDNIPYFALVEYDDPTKVLTFGSGTNFSIQNLDKGSNAHQSRFLRVDLPNDPYVFNLERAVANARYTLENIDRGNEIGQWSDAKCEAFAAVINAADALRGATQEEVDAKTSELNQARTDFINNPNAVIKDELEAAIAAAYAKAAAAQIGIEVGQYYESAIEAFEAQIAVFEESAKTVTDQEACDALTEEVIAATEAFAGNTEIQPVADVLNDAIECAEALYEAEKDNIGTDQGQRPQEAVDAFAAAIAAAKAVSAPEVTDLEALLDARYAFINGAISVNRTPLRKAINEAEAEEFSDLKAGDFNGYYPQENIDAFNAALVAAKEAEADMTKTQEEIDACTKALNDAMTALRKSVVTVKFTELDSAIAKAEAALAGATVIGSGEGQCPQAVVDALNSALAEAKAIDRAAINQASVDTQAETLNSAIAKFTEDLIASTGLVQAIADAQEILDNATQGFKPGNYPVSAINGLSEAIAAANGTADNAESTQADLIAAIETLKAAVESFKAQAIPAHDLTAINAAIAEAEAFIAESGVQDFGLEMALADAKDIVADADNHTKAEIEKARTALIKALEYARENAGIDSVASGKLNVYANAGGIVVEGISGKTIVAVYTLDGRTVTIAETYGPSCSVELSAGKYVVAIRTANVTESNIIIVK